MLGIELVRTQNTPEWREARRTRITASEIYDVLHFPARALQQQVAKRRGEGFTGVAATDYGHAAESVACAAFEEEYGVSLYRPGLVVDPGEPDVFGCSPDAWFGWGDGKHVLVQVKCPHTRDIPDMLPVDYEEQVVFEMGITGIHTGGVFYWTPDQGSQWFQVTWDEDLFLRQRKAARKLWEVVQDLFAGDPDTWPTVDDLKAESAYRDDEEWSEAAAEFYATDQLLEVLTQLVKDAEVKHEARKARLIELSGKANADGAGVRVLWVHPQGKVNWPKLAKDLKVPDKLIESYRAKSKPYAKVEVL